MGVNGKLESVFEDNFKGSMPRKAVSTVYVEPSNNISAAEDNLIFNRFNIRVFIETIC